MSKYGNKKTVVDNITFDSKKEAQRYRDLRLLEIAGEIHDLKLQPKFSVEVNGKKICTYIADFEYYEGERLTYDSFRIGSTIVPPRKVVEDVKGMKTPVYRLKKKLVEALHGVTITEV